MSGQINNNKAFYVYLKMNDNEQVYVGKFVANLDERYTQFRYARSYLNDPRAFPLDPINLPLVNTPFLQYRGRLDDAIPSVFRDNSPDHFNAQVLRHIYSSSPPATEIDLLVLGSSYSVGALEYRVIKGDSGRQEPNRPFKNLEEIQKVAVDIHDGVDVPEKQRVYFPLLLQSSGVPGTRPKTLIEDGNKKYLVKFPARSDRVDVCAIEHVCMKMAKKAGIHTANTRLMQTEMGSVLVVERFDRDTDTGGFHHIMSLTSLSQGYARDTPMANNIRYDKIPSICAAINEEGAISQNDVAKEVFTRMLLNIAIGNTDDHGSNHAFLKKSGEEKITLAPAYDVLCTVGQIGGTGSAIQLSQLGCTPTKENIALAGQTMGLSKVECAQIGDNVMKATANWREDMEAEGLSEKELNILDHSFKGRERIKQYLAQLPEEIREQLTRSNADFMLDR